MYLIMAGLLQQHHVQRATPIAFPTAAVWTSLNILLDFFFEFMIKYKPISTWQLVLLLTIYNKAEALPTNPIQCLGASTDRCAMGTYITDPVDFIPLWCSFGTFSHGNQCRPSPSLFFFLLHKTASLPIFLVVTGHKMGINQQQKNSSWKKHTY